MKKRKTLAVIASDICNDYMNRILIGISRQAKALGYNTVVFLISCNQNDASLIQRGEENIFTMIKKESVDGVILLVGNGSSQKIVNKFKDTFAGWEMPIIAVDYEYDFCDSIYAEDTPLIERMTDHFIEKHGCKKIMCITGPEGNIPAMPRLEGYKRSMKKHGLEIGADDIVFGDFWKIIPKRIAKQIIDGNVERPDAIVCANDVMARTLCNSLVKGGMSIPEDMRISGYDGTDEAVMSIPPITTVCPDNERLGASAVCRLHKAITGAEEEPIESLVGAELLYTSSCGCKDSVLSSVVRSEEYNNKVKRFDRQYSQSGMLECLVEDESLDGFLHKLYRHTFLINDLNFYMLCLCKGWDDVEGAEDDYIREGYTDTMESKIMPTE